MGWFLLGCLINKVLIRGYRKCFDKAKETLKIPDLGTLDEAARARGDNDIETAADEWHQRLGKRLRRGARFFADAHCCAKMAFSLLILLPLHHLLSVFFGESKKEFTSLVDMVGRSNRCADQIHRILQADMITSAEWRLMRAADEMILGDQEFRKYMRRELHRELGGLKCRVVEFYQSGTLPIARSLEMLDTSSMATVTSNGEFAMTLAQCRGGGRECCVSRECESVFRYLGPGNVDTIPLKKLRALKLSFKLWRGIILATERAHAGNQQRAAPKYRKTRSMRRQFCTYVIFLARNRFSKISAAHKTMLHTLSRMSWEQFSKLTKRRTKRFGVGGNKTFTHINAMSFRSRGQGGKEWFIGMRRQWTEDATVARAKAKAKAAAELTPETAPNTLLSLAERRFQRRRRVATNERTALRQNVQARQDDVRLGDAPDGQTHWGMGCSFMPLRPQVLDNRLTQLANTLNVGKRGGLQRLAAKLIPETDLVVAPQNKTLQVYREPSCPEKHCGFCTQADSNIAEKYLAVLKWLKSAERQTDAGEIVLRARPVKRHTLEIINDYDAFVHDRYISFSWMRGIPKYAAMYMQMSRVPERDGGLRCNPNDALTFPFTLMDNEEPFPAIPDQQFLTTGLKSSQIWNVWQTAKSIANYADTLQDGEQLLLERVEFDVQQRLAVVHATSVSEMVTDNVLLQSDAKTKAGQTKEKKDDDEKDNKKNNKRRRIKDMFKPDAGALTTLTRSLHKT